MSSAGGSKDTSARTGGAASRRSPHSTIPLQAGGCTYRIVVRMKKDSKTCLTFTLIHTTKVMTMHESLGIPLSLNLRKIPSQPQVSSNCPQTSHHQCYGNLFNKYINNIKSHVLTVSQPSMKQACSSSCCRQTYCTNWICGADGSTLSRGICCSMLFNLLKPL